jgi:hypothetical protein
MVVPVPHGLGRFWGGHNRRMVMAVLRGHWLLGACLAVAMVHLARCEPPEAAPATVERYIEFRDGTLLRLPVVDGELPLSVVRPEGQIGQIHVRWSDLQRLTFTPERLFQKKLDLLQTVARMGDDKFLVREQAQNDLVKMGPSIRGDLEAAAQLFSDLEIRTRLRRILGMMKTDTLTEEPPAPFDTARLARNKEALLADAGDAIPVRVDGKTYRLPRRDVAALSATSPEDTSFDLPRPGPKGFRRLQQLEDFPRGCIEEGFETAPDGRKLVIGENIEKLFITKGFTLSTSIKTSFVSVNNYNVDARTKGLSAATHQPLWEGEITIRFCKPGREKIPAGVTHFGLWIAHVLPNGTALHAYDFKGRELGVIRTTRNGNEFLAVRSSVPIHTLRVVPNVQIDPNYTLDDFIYTPPQTVDTTHPDRYTTLFENGERISCADVSFERGMVRLHGLPGGLPDQSRPLGELLRVTSPAKRWQDLPQSRGVYVELRDGSVLFGAEPATKGARPTFARWPRGLKEPLKEVEDIAGIWSGQSPRLELPEKSTPMVVWDRGKGPWLPISKVKLLDDGIEWAAASGTQKQGYLELPMVWLARGNDPPPGSWLVRTIQGESIVLGAKGQPQFNGRLSRELNTVWQNDTLTVPSSEIVSITRVPRAP